MRLLGLCESISWLGSSYSAYSNANSEIHAHLFAEAMVAGIDGAFQPRTRARHIQESKYMASLFLSLSFPTSENHNKMRHAGAK